MDHIIDSHILLIIKMLLKFVTQKYIITLNGVFQTF